MPTGGGGGYWEFCFMFKNSQRLMKCFLFGKIFVSSVLLTLVDLFFKQILIWSEKLPLPLGTLSRNYDVILYGNAILRVFQYTTDACAYFLQTNTQSVPIYLLLFKTWTLYREFSYTENFLSTAKVS